MMKVEEEQYMHECLLIIHFTSIETLISGRYFIFLFEFTDVTALSSGICNCDFKS